MIRIYIVISPISCTSTVVFLYTSTPEYLKYVTHNYCALKHSNTSTCNSFWIPHFYSFYLSIPRQIFMHYKYTSFFESSCVTVQYMSHSSRTKDHGTVLCWNEICIMVIAPSSNPEQLLVCWIYCKLPGKLCLFIIKKPNISDESIVPKWSVRVLCQTGLACGLRCWRRPMSQDHYIIDTNVKSEHLRINPRSLIGCT